MLIGSGLPVIEPGKKSRGGTFYMPLSIVKATFTALITLMLSATGSVLADAIPVPQYEVINEAGQNMLTGMKVFTSENFTIGSLTHTTTTNSGSFAFKEDPFLGGLNRNIREWRSSTGLIAPLNSIWQVSFGGNSDAFDENGVSIKGTGAILLKNSDQIWTYVMRDGTRATIDKSVTFTSGGTVCSTCTWGTVTKVEYPDGLTWTMNFEKRNHTLPNGNTITKHRLTSVETNRGYKVLYRYDTSVPTGKSHWVQPSAVIGVNMAVDHCQSYSDCAKSDYDWPRATFEWSGSEGGFEDLGYVPKTIFTITDSSGAKTQYVHTQVGDPLNINGRTYREPFITSVIGSASSGSYTERYFFDRYIKLSLSSALSISMSIGDWLMHKMYVGPASWVFNQKKPLTENDPFVRNYAKGPMEQDAGFREVEIVQNIKRRPALINEVRNNNKIFYLSDDFSNRVTRIEHGEGNYETFEYDARGNIIKKRIFPKPGSSESSKTITASYYLEDKKTCSLSGGGTGNYKVCNKPTQVVDARGNRTIYRYHVDSGKVDAEIQPADAQGNNPVRRFKYEQKYAWYLNSSGNLRRADRPIWVKTKESYCQTGAANTLEGCSKSGDEVVTRFYYGSDGTPSNLNVTERTVTADGETRRSCYQYDQYGNRIGELGPSADITSCP